MRVAILTSRFPKLSETFVLAHVVGLLERGHDVDVFAQSPGDTTVPDEWDRRYGLIGRTHIRPQFSPKLRSRAWKAAQVWLRGGGGIGLSALLATLNARRYGRDAARFRLWLDAASIGARPPYDIIHCHFVPNGLRGHQLRLAGALKGKLLVTTHGADMSVELPPREMELRRAALRAADLLLPISQRWGDRLAEWGCDPARIAVHHMGVVLSRLEPPVRSTGNGPLRIVSVARLVLKKGIEHALRAVARLGDEVRWTYSIIGDGPLGDELRKLAGELRVADRVHFLGACPHEQTVRVLRESDIALAPSVTGPNGDQEGIPVSLMEAMALGLPVVSTLHSGIPELVEDTVSGFLVPERDDAALAQRLNALASDATLRDRMGRAGREAVERGFDQSRLDDELVSVYRRLCGGAGSASST